MRDRDICGGAHTTPAVLEQRDLRQTKLNSTRSHSTFLTCCNIYVIQQKQQQLNCQVWCDTSLAGFQQVYSQQQQQQCRGWQGVPAASWWSPRFAALQW